MAETQPHNEQPYRLYRDPALPFWKDPRLQRFAEDLERAEQFRDHDPESPQFQDGYAAAEETLRSYIERQGYPVAGPPEAPPDSDTE